MAPERDDEASPRGEPGPTAPGQRVGILGGTFDPVHLGHLVTARDVAEGLGLDRILLIPAGVPPHKEGEVTAPAAFRRRMLEVAVAGDPLFQVDSLELEREGPSYTVDTLRELGARWPGVELFLLMGTDQWRDFATWKQAAEVAQRATVTVMTRTGDEPAEMKSAKHFPFAGVAVTRMDISSSELRARIRAGRSVRYLVPPDVEALLTQEGGVYGSPPGQGSAAGASSPSGEGSTTGDTQPYGIEA
ncbi:MAG: nicotinate-nucleotide adenylyltransferase [Gemmatimonadota bacterium]